MINVSDKIIELHTKRTSYIMKVAETGQLEHLYYGEKISLSGDELQKSAGIISEKHVFPMGYTMAYDKAHPEISLEDMCLEMSGRGKGDQRDVFLDIVHENGSTTTDFVYEKSEVDEVKEELRDLPGSYDESGKVEHLKITLADKNSGLKLNLNYYVYPACDVITRTTVLANEGETEIRLKRLMSCQLDFDENDFICTTFNGAWAREMHRHDTAVSRARVVNSTCMGTSSSRANPFTMLAKKGAQEDFGEVYGFNLIYSGNHYESVEENAFGKVRFISGINPETFEAVLAKGECFEAPEAVMTYSAAGYNGMSHNMHEFVRKHIVRGSWRDKERPVLLNSWEAAYFNIDEGKLLRLAKAGKEVGIELLVMDDGWFGKRNDDTSSLGDWEVNKKKLPGGIAGIADKVNKLGLQFGIWVEPEMVNVNSELYKAHPDWAIDIPSCEHTEGRNQRLLDLANPEVVDYVIESMRKVFSAGNIAYVKWDMNRGFSDYYSKYLDAKHQGETNHRYVQGLYRCMRTLTEEFPDILFEGCAGGGNRFDLGILSYFPQIWASDDTDALERIYIQQGYSYGYPMSCVSAHVSGAPNHQTLRRTPLETRFNVAAFGVCGYECNLCDMKQEEIKEISAQIATYKKWRRTMQFGTFYRYNQSEDNKCKWMVVSEDKKKAAGMLFQKLVVPNTAYDCFKAKGLESDYIYEFYNEKKSYNIKNFGDLVNTASPVHIKPDSILHNVAARFIRMDGEAENCKAYGNLFMKAGVKLSPAFSATGYNDKVRYFQDFASRLYFFEAEE